MSKRVYGIDLGTTYSCISYVDDAGKPIVVMNAEGELTTPSVVYFESPDSIVVGRAAKDVSVIHKDRVVSTIKRSMGDVNYRFSVDGTAYRPEEISAHILRKLVKDAAIITGDEIKDVVITCPAYFGVTEKELTKQAGVIAGLNVLYVIPEPTAAAIAYGMEQIDAQNILVYDLGGGTFDVSLIKIATGEITVIATDGDVLLGGKDWDDDIVSYLANAFEAETGTPAKELIDNIETYQELLNDAERTKIRLTAAKSSTLKVRYQTDSATVELTRQKFDEITQAQLERTVSFTEEMIRRAKEKGIAKIDKLLLVGGSTYMPQIVERMSKFKIEVKQFDPNQAVAKGAAIFGYRCALEQLIKIEIAATTGQDVKTIDLDTVPVTIKDGAELKVSTAQGVALPGLKKLVDTKITNVTSKSFGVVIFDPAADREKVTNLVFVDDPLPIKDKDQEFSTLYDNQTEVDLRVMQNIQREQLIELSGCAPAEPIGRAELKFARPLPKGSPLKVTFCLSPDGRLSLHGKDLTTGGEIQAEFKTEALMTDDQLAQARSRAGAISIS
jgi:molecular chaperone DnaK